MGANDRMGDDSMDNLTVKEIDYSLLYKTLTSEDRVARMSARFSGQISYYDRNGIYTDYIIASEATARGIIQSLAGDGISISFIEDSDGSLSLADTIWAQKNNQKILDAQKAIAGSIANIL